MRSFRLLAVFALSCSCFAGNIWQMFPWTRSGSTITPFNVTDLVSLGQTLASMPVLSTPFGYSLGDLSTDSIVSAFVTVPTNVPVTSAPIDPNQDGVFVVGQMSGTVLNTVNVAVGELFGASGGFSYAGQVSTQGVWGANYTGSVFSSAKGVAGVFGIAGTAVAHQTSAIAGNMYGGDFRAYISSEGGLSSVSGNIASVHAQAPIGPASGIVAAVLVDNVNNTSTDYAIRTGVGKVYLGDVLQLSANISLPFLSAKSTQSAAAPGAGFADLRWVAGTNAGSCKLVGNAGTSSTEVTIVDNVGSGC